MQNLKQYNVIVSDKARKALGEIIAYIASDSIANAASVKKELIKAIKTKEIQLAKLKEHIDKSTVCSDL